MVVDDKRSRTASLRTRVVDTAAVDTAAPFVATLLKTRKFKLRAKSSADVLQAVIALGVPAMITTFLRMYPSYPAWAIGLLLTFLLLAFWAFVRGVQRRDRAIIHEADRLIDATVSDANARVEAATREAKDREDALARDAKQREATAARDASEQVAQARTLWKAAWRNVDPSAVVSVYVRSAALYCAQSGEAELLVSTSLVCTSAIPCVVSMKRVAFTIVSLGRQETIVESFSKDLSFDFLGTMYPCSDSVVQVDVRRVLSKEVVDRWILKAGPGFPVRLYVDGKVDVSIDGRQSVPVELPSRDYVIVAAASALGVAST